MADALMNWLLDSDPALRWQVERDLAGAPEQVWRATRSLVATEGFGARLLALQDADGQWGGGAYFPGPGRRPGPEEKGQPWTATTWSLNLLREWGVDAAALGDTADRLRRNSRWEYDDLPYWGGEVDCCINAWTLMNGVWLGVDVTGLAEWFVEHRLPDDGWNCQWEDGSTRSSFHSTLSSLRGLLAHEVATGGTERTRDARRQGQVYLLRRNLFRRLSTGEPVGPWTTDFIHPSFWIYSVLTATEYFRKASLQDGAPPDPRMAEAVELVRAARQPDGTFLQGGRPPGRMWFEVDVPRGEPSRWLTFVGTRVLAWWDAVAG